MLKGPTIAPIAGETACATSASQMNCNTGGAGNQPARTISASFGKRNQMKPRQNSSAARDRYMHVIDEGRSIRNWEQPHRLSEEERAGLPMPRKGNPCKR
jgi:hypothetical protein